MAQPLPLTALLACLMAAWMLLLAIRVVGMRRAGGVVLGDDGDRALQKAIRGHGNAAEQVPVFLILFGLAEAGGAPGWMLLPLAALFAAGRLAHGLYFGWHGLTWRLRFWGMWATVLAQAAAILAVLVTLAGSAGG